MDNDIRNQRLKQLFNFLISLDSFKLGKYLFEIEGIVFISLIRDYHVEIEKNIETVTIKKATLAKTRNSKENEELNYGFNQADSNMFNLVIESCNEDIEKTLKRTEDLNEKIAWLTKRLNLESIFTIYSEYSDMTNFERAIQLYSLIEERKNLYKLVILNQLEPVVYCKAINEAMHKLKHSGINNQQISDQNEKHIELQNIIDGFTKSLFDSRFIHDIKFEPSVKDQFLF